jgi:hypothetical protein
MTDSPITFQTPRDVLRFIRACLEDENSDRLFGAMREATSKVWQARIFEDLREIEVAETLENVFLVDNSFPKEETEFKLGGHSHRTRHLHLDLVRVEDSWRLHKIWKCR